MEPTLNRRFFDLRELEVLNPAIIRLFLKTKVRILVVTDRGIMVSTGGGFGVGKVIDIVESNEFFPCADFTIHCAHRNIGTPSINTSADSHQFRYTNFRFDMAGFNINDYDQVWFFGFNPGNNPGGDDIDIIQSSQSPMTDAELVILGQWMDTKGGGVLAMGDHHYLGASMCHRIPRVRNMRRWTEAQGVPTQFGFDRHDTNQPASAFAPTVPTSVQYDNVPQPIEVLKKVHVGPFFFRHNFTPHPILCGVDGVITVLPDHPHEGETLGKRFDTGSGGIPVDTTLTTGISGYNVQEYPNGIGGNPKPEPEIIALGHPLNDSRHGKNNDSRNPSNANETKPFGLISVYDGEKAGVGRVVVDSTWHHWFNENLNGFDVNSSHYKQIRNYFMNVAAWLCRKPLRDDMIFCGLWDYVVVEYHPMNITVHDSIWHLGVQARDVLGRIASRCTATEWISDIFIVDELRRFKLPPEPFPCLTCPPFELFETAILGGVMKSIFPLVETYMLQSTSGRVKVDAKEIAKLAKEGITIGQKAYFEAFAASKKMSDEMFNSLPKAFKKDNGVTFEPTIEKLRLLVTVDTILFNDRRIAYLLSDGNYKLDFDLSVNGVALPDGKRAYQGKDMKIAAHKVINELTCANLGSPLHEGPFEEGEQLSVQLFLVNSEGDGSDRTLLWQRRFEGAPSSWIGKKQALLLAADNGDGCGKTDVILSIVESKKK